MGRVRVYLAAFVAVILSACQTLPQVPYDRATATVKTINLVTPATPDRARVVLATTVGQSFGLIGALIDAGMQQAREDKFAAIASSRNFSARDSLLQYLDAGLKADGYQVNMVGVGRQKLEFLKDYPAQPTGDAHFDVLMNYGYVATGISTPYRPFVYIECRLVRASDKQTLMQRTVVYNPIFGVPEQAVTVAPDPTYVFDDFEALQADPEKAVKGVDRAIEEAAKAIGTLLQ